MANQYHLLFLHPSRDGEDSSKGAEGDADTVSGGSDIVPPDPDTLVSPPGDTMMSSPGDLAASPKPQHNLKPTASSSSPGALGADEAEEDELPVQPRLETQWKEVLDFYDDLPPGLKSPIQIRSSFLRHVLQHEEDVPHFDREACLELAIAVRKYVDQGAVLCPSLTMPEPRYLGDFNEAAEVFRRRRLADVPVLDNPKVLAEVLDWFRGYAEEEKCRHKECAYTDWSMRCAAILCQIAYHHRPFIAAIEHTVRDYKDWHKRKEQEKERNMSRERRVLNEDEEDEDEGLPEDGGEDEPEEAEYRDLCGADDREDEDDDDDEDDGDSDSTARLVGILKGQELASHERGVTRRERARGLFREAEPPEEGRHE